jgi:hypothetical protein
MMLEEEEGAKKMEELNAKEREKTLDCVMKVMNR